MHYLCPRKAWKFHETIWAINNWITVDLSISQHEIWVCMKMCDVSHCQKYVFTLFTCAIKTCCYCIQEGVLRGEKPLSCRHWTIMLLLLVECLEKQQKRKFCHSSHRKFKPPTTLHLFFTCWDDNKKFWIVIYSTIFQRVSIERRINNRSAKR